MKLTKDEVRKVAHEFTENRILITYNDLSRKIYGRCRYNIRILKEVVEEEKKLQYEVFPQSNTPILQSSTDIWVLYYKDLRGKLKRNIVDFTCISNKYLRGQVKQYMRYVLSKNIKAQDLALIRYIDILDISNIKSVTKVEAHHLFIELQQDIYNISVSTIKKVFNALGKLYSYFDSNTSNPFKEVKFHNVRGMSTKTEVIPLTILEFLDNNNYKLKPEFSLYYRVLRYTGMRASEALTLKHSYIGKDVIEGYRLLQYIPHKISNYTNGKFAMVYITNELALELSDFNVTSEFIFKHSNTRFMEVINKLLKDNNIKWKFTSRQLRKTLATQMIEKGATVQQVANQLNHLQFRTTEEYYIEVNKNKLANMNKDFINQLCSEKCEVELYKNCAYCSKLCTSREHLENWVNLYNKQQQKVNMLSKSDPVYTREYDLLCRYKEIIQKIKEL